MPAGPRDTQSWDSITMNQNPSTASATAHCDIYYDGACPLCRAEIDFYRRIGTRARFHDLTGGGATPVGVCRADALARFHVTDAGGRVRSGARAFAELWKASPGAWRILGHIAAVPPFVWIAEAVYRLFLRIRPRLQRLYRDRVGAGH